MNCFFASCEIAENPELKGKSVAVGHLGNDRKGIILASTYEARKYGIHAAMPINEALRKCPDLVLVEPRMEVYSDYSRRFFDYFLSITPLVEPGSIDEAYLDVTDVCAPSLIIDLAHNIQNDLLELFSLPCSIGIAPNKFLAKMASDMKKPLGITILRKREIAQILWPLTITDMFGVGKKSIDSFKALGIKTIGDLANYKDLKLLRDVLGRTNAESLYAHANGEGNNEIDVSRFNEVSSLSVSQTLDNDEYDVTKMKMMLKILSNVIANRLEKSNVVASTFTLQIKYFNFKQTSKSKTFTEGVNASNKIYEIILDLFEELYEIDVPVRLFGIGASKLSQRKTELKQLSLFDKLDEEEKEYNVNNLLNEINKNIGFDIIKKGCNSINNNSKNKIDTDKYDKSWRGSTREDIRSLNK